MGRLPIPALDAASDEVRNIFDTYMKERGNVPNAFRTLALRPGLLTTVIAHYRQVMFEGEIPFRTKELLFLHVSRLNRCHY